MRAGRESTRGPAVIAYAVRSVVRNRRTTVSALAGIVLGVAVATAPWVSLDSSVRGLVDYYLEGLPFDLRAFGERGNLDAAAGALRAVPDVVRVEPVATWVGTVNGTVSGHPAADGWYWFQFVQGSFASVTGDFGISWDVPPAAGGVVVDVSLRDVGFGVGDDVVAERRVPITDANGTVTGYEVWTASFAIGGFYRSVGSVTITATNTVFASAADADGFAVAMNVTGFEFSGNLFAWLDRAALLNAFDASGSSERLRRELVLAQNALLPLGYDPMYARSARGLSLLEIPAQIDTATFALRILFMGLAIPTLAIAALLAKVGYEVGLSSRRRELAVLRARGLSARGVQVHLLAETAVVGALGAALGLFLALGLSRLFSPGTLLPAGVIAMDVAVSPGTALLALLLGWLLAIAVARTPARLVASEDLVGAMKAFHAEEAGIAHRPSRDFLVSAVGAAGLLLLLAWGSVRDSPLGIATFFVGFSTALLAPMAPFFLVLGFARYLTRGTDRAYRALARLFRPLLGELDALVDRNLVRAPRRSANTAMIVTFVVGFVLVMSVLVASAKAYEEEQILWSAPADLIVNSPGYLPGWFNATSVAAVRAVPGVAAATPVISVYTERGGLILFDAASYRRTVPWLRADHLGGVDPVALLDALSRGTAFAANPQFKTEYGLQPGDVMTFGPVFNDSATVRLHGYVPRLPGLFSEGYTVAFLDFAAVPDADLSLSADGRYLIALAPGASGTEVADAVSAVLGGSSWTLLREEVRRQAGSNPVSATVFGFLETQAYLSVVVLVVAIALLVYSASVDRRDELATLLARGIEPKMATRLLMAEGWVVSLLGLLLGVLGGLVTAATFLGLGSAISPTPIPMVVPATAAIPLLAVVVGVWVAGFLGAASVRRMDVPRVLKLRGG